MRPYRPFCVLSTFGLVVALAAPSVAADGPPSAVRVRQMFRGVPARPVQGSESDFGPRLLEPRIEIVPDEGFRSNRPEPPLDIESEPGDAPPVEAPADIAPPIDITPRTSPPFSNGLPPSGAFPPGRPPAGSFPPAEGAPVEAAGDDCDFWIVSSRNCPQQAAGRLAACPLGFFRCDRGNRPIRADASAFRQSLSPGTPVCVVVHGSFTDWQTVCIDAAATHRWLRQAAPHLPMAMVFYSWPSEAATVVLPPLDTEILGGRAEFNGLYLTQLVQWIPPQNPVCLMGHSHGARAVTSCLHLLGGGRVQGYRLPNAQAIPHRVRGVFIAAALDRHWLSPGQQYCAALPRTETIVNVRNCADWALSFYPMRSPFSGSAIGREGLDPDDRRRLGPLAARFQEFDVAPLLGTQHLWPSYLRRPEIASRLVPAVYFVDANPPSPTSIDVRSFSPTPETGSPAGLVPLDQPSPAAPPGQRFAPPDRQPSAVPGQSPFDAPRDRGLRSIPEPPPRTFAPETPPESSPRTETPDSAPRTYAPDDAPRTYAPDASRPGHTLGAARPQSVPYYRVGPLTFPAPGAWNSPRRAPPANGWPTNAPQSSPPSAAPPSAQPRAMPPANPWTGGRPAYASPGDQPDPAAPSAQPPANRLAPVPGSPGVPSSAGPRPAVTPGLPSEPDATHPVHIDGRPFERPTRPLPSIFRRYYPEADGSLGGPHASRLPSY